MRATFLDGFCLGVVVILFIFLGAFFITGAIPINKNALYTHFSEYCNGDTPNLVSWEYNNIIVECPEEVNANVNVVVRNGGE